MAKIDKIREQTAEQRCGLQSLQMYIKIAGIFSYGRSKPLPYNMRFLQSVGVDAHIDPKKLLCGVSACKGGNVRLTYRTASGGILFKAIHKRKYPSEKFGRIFSFN